MRIRTLIATALYGVLLCVGWPGIGISQEPNRPPELPPDAQPQVLTRGPVHEAFAEVVEYDPQPGIIVGREPPKPVNEIPPDVRPESEGIEWIPGYWAWDDEREDFLWVSGVWRQPPPRRRWVPGAWEKVAAGWQWFPGFWAEVQPRDDLAALPVPPQTLDYGPNGPSAGEDYFWVPGCWRWQSVGYAWQPGFWSLGYSGWTWIPHHYRYGPRGAYFVRGYWDYPLVRRGVLFAPVYWAKRHDDHHPYVPRFVVPSAHLAAHLFVHPRHHHYRFGDYYASKNLSRGIYPSFHYHRQRHGYDPLFVHHRVLHHRANPHWLSNLTRSYEHRRDHVAARPPRTFADQRPQHTSPPGGVDRRVARPLDDWARAQRTAHGNVARLSAGQRESLARTAPRTRQAIIDSQRAAFRARPKTSPHVRANPHRDTIIRSQSTPSARTLFDPGRSAAAAQARARAQRDSRTRAATAQRERAARQRAAAAVGRQLPSAAKSRPAVNRQPPRARALERSPAKQRARPSPRPQARTSAPAARNIPRHIPRDRPQRGAAGAATRHARPAARPAGRPQSHSAGRAARPSPRPTVHRRPPPARPPARSSSASRTPRARPPASKSGRSRHSGGARGGRR